MDPFKVAAPLKDLIDAYPAADVIIDAGKTAGEQARFALARLWLSEGIPYAFRDCPAVYESMRSWLASWLGVHAKDINLTGSARIGVSLSPKKSGKSFGDSSDLDIFVVSNGMFNTLRDEFHEWCLHYESGRVTPRNEREEAFWEDNNSRGPKLIARGFLDQNMIPNLDDYPNTKKISNAMWLLVEKLKVTPQAPKPNHASIRCYSSWDGFVKQVALNLQ